MHPLLAQAFWALGYYVALLAIIRLSGKRLSGQTTTSDLIVLIAIAVALQQLALQAGDAQAIVFIVTLFAAHVAQTAASTRWPALRRLVRGRPRPLVRDGVVDRAALADEHLTPEDLLAGLRKQGAAGPEEVRLAVMEETGQITVLRR